jgi:uncharacterized protein YggE
MNLHTFAAVTIAAGCLSAMLPAGAATTVADATAATITVTGQGEVTRPPDRAIVAVTIVTNDDNAARALAENNRRFAGFGAKLATLGIGATDIRSTSVQSDFNARPSAPNPGATGPYGFVVTRNAQVDISNLGQTGAVIDTATSAGATQINGVSYDFRDRRAVERAALAAAVADAYAQAQTLAAAAHVQIVRVLHIGNAAGLERPVPMAMSMARKTEVAEPTTISPSDLDVTNSITVTYAIR